MRYHFEFGPAIQEGMLFKDFFSFSSGCHFVQPSKTIKAIF